MNCVACEKPLTLTVEAYDEDDVGQDVGSSSTTNVYTVPDSVEMQCGCHFHWFVFRRMNVVLRHATDSWLVRQCLLDAYSMTECPKCGRDISTTGASGEQQILCNLNNEGGLQTGLDILPLLSEESYLKAYPEERRCKAFLEFCAEGDIEAIVDLLDNDEATAGEDSDNVEARIDVLRYQDPMRSMNSGLHIAILNDREKVAWLLLSLASNLESTRFPLEVLQAAEKLGIRREDQTGEADIRSLRDSEGMTAEQHAKQIGGIWNTWLECGRLTAGLPA